MTTGSPFSAKARAARWTRSTNGHVASTIFTPRASASLLTRGATPWAGRIIVAPGGTSPGSSAMPAPLRRRAAVTISLCTGSCRQKAPLPSASAFLTALSTPAQKPCGDITSTLIPTRYCFLSCASLRVCRTSGESGSIFIACCANSSASSYRRALRQIIERLFNTAGSSGRRLRQRLR